MERVAIIMRKTVLIPLLTTCFALAGCGQKAPEAPKTCEEVAAAVADGQAFEELTPQDRPEIVAYLGLSGENLTDAALWMDASAATVEMVAVLTAKDDAALKALEEEVRVFWKDLTETYRDYAPDEVPKLESAVLETRGMQLAFVLCKDAAAAKSALDAVWKSNTNSN